MNSPFEFSFECTPEEISQTSSNGPKFCSRNRRTTRALFLTATSSYTTVDLLIHPLDQGEKKRQCMGMVFIIPTG